MAAAAAAAGEDEEEDGEEGRGVRRGVGVEELEESCRSRSSAALRFSFQAARIDSSSSSSSSVVRDSSTSSSAAGTEKAAGREEASPPFFPAADVALCFFLLLAFSCSCRTTGEAANEGPPSSPTRRGETGAALVRDDDGFDAMPAAAAAVPDDPG